MVVWNHPACQQTKTMEEDKRCVSSILFLF
ncbi:hypothetical protein HRbin14_00850 [bacterium HR14]|nr:hypothetical protein HRbin14_00850 [bacterium HR14]